MDVAILFQLAGLGNLVILYEEGNGQKKAT